MAVEAVGLDIFTGISIWQKYAEFELDNLEDYLTDLKEDSSMDLRSLNKAKQNITKVYLRQLSLPLVGNDSTLAQFQEILSQYYSESDIDIIQPTTLETNFLGASKMLEERLPFEMKIYDEGYRSLTKCEQLMIWEEYITFELRQNKVDRLNRLYERLLLHFSEDVEIWLAYCGCTLCIQHDFLLTTKVVKRGLMVHYYDLLLRRTLLLSINFRQIRLLESGLIHSKEQANIEINSLRANFVEALAIGFSQAEEYLDFYFTFINCTRRLLCQMMIAKNRCALDALLFVKDEFMSSISELQQFLLNYYPQWKLAWETLAFYQSHQIYSLITPLEKHLRTSEELPQAEIWTKTSFERNYELWHFFLQQNFSDYTSYQYFISQLINIKDYNSVSYVYRQLYADRTRQIMDKKSIVKDWMKFEENYRDMNEFTATLAKFFPKVSDICSKSISSVSVTSNSKDVNVKEKKGGRKRDRIGETEEEDDGKVSKTKRYKVQFQAEIKNESKIEEDKLKAFVPSTVQGDAGFDDIKTNIVCIKNFPYAAPANKIYDFIHSILPYHRIEMIFTKAGNSRGMVNVEYKDSSEIVQLLSLKDLLVYEERPLEIEFNVPSLLNFDPQIFCTIFVNHLPQEFSEEQLIDYFSSCGTVSKIKLAKDKKSELKKVRVLVLRINMPFIIDLRREAR